MTLAEETNQERAARYLKMATETGAMAQRASDPGAAEAYLHLATIWTKMADDLTARRPANEQDGDADEARA